MISKFVREQKRYTQQQLGRLFQCSAQETVQFIRKLKEFGVLKAVKASKTQQEASELIDEDVELSEVDMGNTDYLYVFTFVGIITLAGRVLKCYPKYLLTNSQPKDELKQILKVLERYNSKKQIVRMFNDSSESNAFNLLAVLLFLLNDYYENEVYSNTEDILESNGSGEIFWDKTINETFALISDNRPYYIDIQTKKRITNDFDYFKRLHQCILTKVSAELKDADLLDLFDLNEVYLTDEELDDFGEKGYILYRIEKELNVQFNTRKQLVLKTLYAYIDQGGSLYDTDCLSLFGTNSFNLVWEAVCADIMDNQLDVRLDALPLPVPLNEEYDGSKHLIDLIEKPFWTITEKTANDTLIPDLITIKDGRFIIFDAKYYLPKLKKGEMPKAQPGIESVTKQFLYQLAYKDFISAHGFATVRNCFLIPTEEKDIADKGEIQMKMFSALGLQNIKVKFLPADMAYDFYLSGKKIDIDLLEL